MIEVDNKKSKRGIFPMVLIFILLFLYTYNDMNSGSTSYVFTARDRTSTHILLILLIAFIILYYCSIRGWRHKRAPLIGMYGVLAVWVFLNFIMNSKGVWTLATYCGFLLWWIFTILLTMAYFSKYPGNISVVMTLVLAIFAYYVYESTRVALFANTVAVAPYATLNIIYRILVFVPLFTLINRKWLRNALFMIIGVLTLISMKRGAIIAYPVMLIAYIYALNRVQNKSQSSLFKIIGIVALIFAALYIANSLTNGYIAYRFSLGQLEFASGRTERWTNAIAVIMQRNLWTLLVGSGIGNSDIALHNEALEFLYSYGLIGFLLFIAQLFALMKNSGAYLRAHSRFAPGYAAILVYFAVTSFVSGFNFMHGTFFIMLYIGIASQLNGCEMKNKGEEH